MKISSLSILGFCLALLLSSCSIGSDKTPEITEFRLKEAASCQLTATKCISTTQSSNMKVSFLGSCVTIASAKKLLNIVLATTDGEITITDIQKRSDMICTPNKASVSTLWVSTVDKKVFRYDSSKYQVIAQK